MVTARAASTLEATACFRMRVRTSVGSSAKSCWERPSKSSAKPAISSWVIDSAMSPSRYAGIARSLGVRRRKSLTASVSPASGSTAGTNVSHIAASVRRWASVRMPAATAISISSSLAAPILRELG